MGKQREITVRCFISRDGAPEVPLESLTPEERALAGRKMGENMKKSLEMYYANHWDEWLALGAAK